MTDKEILEKAIQKAIDGGWKPSDDFWDVISPYTTYPDMTSFKEDVFYEQWCTLLAAIGLESVIFNHDFAKALWGDKKNDVCNGDDMLFQAPWWEFHLSQMVIAPDPIEYLGENI